MYTIGNWTFPAINLAILQLQNVHLVAMLVPLTGLAPMETVADSDEKNS